MAIRALVVEDQPVSLKLLCALLEKLGVVAVGVTSAAESLDKVRSQLADAEKFDFICLDIRMPEMDGRTAVKEIRSLGFTGPVFAFTAMASVHGKKECLDAGFTAYFSKTALTIELLEALINQHCPK